MKTRTVLQGSSEYIAWLMESPGTTRTHLEDMRASFIAGVAWASLNALHDSASAEQVQARIEAMRLETRRMAELALNLKACEP